MKQILKRIFHHEELTREEACTLMQRMTGGEMNEAQTAALLAAFQMRGVKVDELVGFRDALLQACVPVDLHEFHPIDIVGTGGDGKNTFNISTCACFVVAGAGYRVAKQVADLPQMRLYTNTLQQLGIQFAVVNNLDGYDEISLTDEFKVMTNRYETIYRPSELGFSMARQEELYGGNTPEEAAAIFDRVLHNEGSKAQTDCVLINASFAIQALEPQKKIEECVALAKESLESGKALATLCKFLTLNQ